MAAVSGSDVRSLREELQLTTTDLATLLGVSNSTVRRWESVPTAQVDAGSARVLAVLKDELAQKRGENERRAFKAAIMKALLVGGGLFALFVVLKAVFDKPKNSEEPDER
ncbi:MAG: helix-turn-helix domain-containing protein [Deltaproteobacteria bacterium]|nr:helix-turn-helix domain-containing protein [Deltaproteobacteria bacterium]